MKEQRLKTDSRVKHDSDTYNTGIEKDWDLTRRVQWKERERQRSVGYQ